MSGTWSTLGTLKLAYYNIFFIYYSHECVTAICRSIATISF